MRKRLKNKRRSSKLCKLHKMGVDNRWNHREFERLKIAEKEIATWTSTSNVTSTEPRRQDRWETTCSPRSTTEPDTQD